MNFALFNHQNLRQKLLLNFNGNKKRAKVGSYGYNSFRFLVYENCQEFIAPESNVHCSVRWYNNSPPPH